MVQMWYIYALDSGGYLCLQHMLASPTESIASHSKADSLMPTE